MDIVFIHGNFPGQFKHLAAGLASAGEHRVFFLTAREDADDSMIPGVIIRQFKEHRSPNVNTHHYLVTTEEAVLKGQSVLRALNQLMEEGVRPRLVISHGGMGLGLFVKDLLPQATHIGLFEWYFRPHTTRWLLEDFGINEQLQTRMRNLPILEELESCDAGVVPTDWQKSQFPVEFNQKLNVIFDGIDTEFFKPNPSIDETDVELQGEELDQPLRLKKGTPVLSYATRGMETLRGFPEFLRLAASALREIPELQVIVAGRDRRAYSYDASSHNGSWKDFMLDELGDFEGRNRLHFTGLMPYQHYRTLLQRSTLHCYFTRPYVTSWSLFEAAACGARLCINKSKATESILINQDQACWIDLDRPEENKSLILECLTESSVDIGRAIINEKYSLEQCLPEWQALVNRCLAQG